MLTLASSSSRYKKLLVAIIACQLFSQPYCQAQSKTDSVWILTDNGCKIYNPHPVKDETISWSGACINGYAIGEGTLIWFKKGKKNQEYNGQMKKGIPNGKGKYDYLDGHTQEGEYVNGILEGNGRSIDRNKNSIITYYYDGEFKKGSPNGYGEEIYFYEDGDTASIYKGNFSDWYHKDGAGLLKIYGNVVTMIKGNFKNDQAEGVVEIWDYADKNLIKYYKGNYKNNGRNGYGEEICGVNKYSGEWENNEMKGKGTLTTDNILIYDGEWANNKFDGLGKRFFFDGGYYFGEFKRNERNGFGVMRWKDGTKYVGEFRNELFEGRGYTSKEMKPGSSGVWQKGMLLTTDTYREIKQSLLERYKKKPKSLIAEATLE